MAVCGHTYPSGYKFCVGKLIVELTSCKGAKVIIIIDKVQH